MSLSPPKPFHSLSIISYPVSGAHTSSHPRLHWALFIHTSNRLLPITGGGIMHQLSPITGAYRGAEIMSYTGTSSSMEVDIGLLPAHGLKRVEEVCRNVCGRSKEAQEWVLEVVKELKKDGIVDGWVNERFVRRSFEEDGNERGLKERL